MSCELVPGTYGIPYNKGGKIIFYCLSEDQLKHILCHGLSQHGVTANGGFYGGKNSQAQGRSTAIGRNAKALNPGDGTTSESIQIGEGTNLESKTLKIFDWRLLKSDGVIDDERLPHFKIELKAEDGYIQWRYIGTDEWFNLISIDSLQGADGQSIEIAEETPIDELKIVEIQNAVNTGIYIVLVPPGGDNRTNQTVPAGINGDVSGHIISYNGDTDEWNDYGSFSGIPGTDGKEVELRNNGTHIQWKYDTDGAWLNLVSLATITGPQGVPGNDGNTPIFQVAGGYIQYSVDDGSTWTNLIDTTILIGEPGPAGTPGVDGKDVELRTSGDFLQWRQITEPASTWTSIYNLASLQGADGKNPQFRLSSGYIQWRLVGDPTWINLVPLTDITGPAGPQGIQGPQGLQGVAGVNGVNGINGRDPEFRTQSGWLQWRLVGDTSWISLIYIDTTGSGGGETSVIFSAGTPSIENPLGTVWINAIGNEYRLVPNEVGDSVWVQTGPFTALQDFVEITIDSVTSTPIQEGISAGSITVIASGGVGTLYYTLNPLGITNTTGIFDITTIGNYTVSVTQGNNYSTQVTDPIYITEITQESWYEYFNFVGITIGSTDIVNNIVGGEDLSIIDSDLSVGDTVIPESSSTKVNIGGTIYTISDLINNDYPDILVKFNHSAPHNITLLGILKPEYINNLTQLQLDELHEIFELWTWWQKVVVPYTEVTNVHNISPTFITYSDGEFVVNRIWNGEGFMKDNRPISVAPEFEDPTFELTEFTFEDGFDIFIGTKVGEVWTIEEVIIPVDADYTVTQLSAEGATDGAITVINPTGAESYEYSNDDGVTWQASNEFTGLAAGTYDLRIRDAANTSNDVLLGTITISHVSSNLIYTITPDTVITPETIFSATPI